MMALSAEQPLAPPFSSTPDLNSAHKLHQRAEDLYQQQSADLNNLTSLDYQRLVHELGVHQIELELQNEELRQVRNELEARQVYIDLFDFAPVGYFTLARDGAILQVNQTGSRQLGVESARLVGTRFAFFVTEPDRVVFNQFLNRIFSSQSMRACEITLQRDNHIRLWVQLEGIAAGNGQVCRLVVLDITERKHAEEALQQSEQKFSLLFEKSPFALALSRMPDSVIVDVNEAFESIFGYTKSEALGKTSLELGINPDAEGRARILAALKENGSVQDLEVPLRTKSGEYHIMSVNLAHMNIQDQKFILNLTQDITDRKVNEKRIAKLTQLYLVLSQVNEIIVRTRDIHLLFMEVCRIVAQGDYPLVWIGQVNQQQVLPEAWAGSAVDYLKQIKVEMEGEFSTGPTAACIHENRSIINNDFMINPAARPWCESALQFGFRASAAIPLHCQDRVIGALTLYASKPDSFDSEQINLLEALAADVSYALDAIRQEQLQKKAEHALAESEARYRSLYENSLDGIILLMPDGSILAANPQACRLFGMSEAELIEKGRQGVFVYNKALTDALNQREQTGRAHAELDLIRNDGLVFIGEVSSSTFIGRDGTRMTSMIVRDITLRKQAEEALRKSERDFSTLVKNTPDVVMRFDTDQRYIYINQAAEHIFGVSTDCVIGKTPVEFNSSSPQAHLLYRSLKTVLDTGTELEIELSKSTASGLKYFMTRIVPECDDQGKIESLLAISRDITRRFLAEEEIKLLNSELEQRVDERTVELVDAQQFLQDLYTKYRIVADNTYSWEYWMNMDGQFLYISPSCKRLTGYAEESFQLNPDLYLQIIFPDDLPIWQQHRMDELTQNASGQIEFRIRNADGLICWVGHVCQPVYSHQDVFLGTRGSNRDITGSKLAEEAIRRHAARAEALVRTAAYLNAHLDLDTLLQTVCQQTAAALHVPAAWVNLWDQQCETLSFASGFGLPPGFKERYQSPPLALYNRYASAAADSIICIPDLQLTNDYPNYELYRTLNIHSSASASMLRDGQLIGVLCIITLGDEARYFSEEEKSLLQGLGNQAAQAIVNARLFQEVSAAHQRLRDLSQALFEIQETERRSLALELHDELGQLLSSTKMSLDLIPFLSGPAAMEQLERAQILINDLLQRVRRMALDLRPGMLDDLGLIPALNWLFRDYQARTGESVFFEHSGLERRFSPRLEVSSYRIIQEALTNVIRHAGNKQVYIHVWVQEPFLCLEVLDHGVGFDLAWIQSMHASSGLSGMVERAHLLGGELRIQSSPGAGTRLTARLPVNPDEEKR
jgi:PAS domain S-box-containing protein